jgi:hypothetical protein
MSKRNGSEIIGGAGFVAGLITELVNGVEAKGVSMEALYRLVKPEGRPTLDQLIEIIAAAGQGKPASAFPIFPELLGACRFDRVDVDIAEHNFKAPQMMADPAEMMVLSQDALGGRHLDVGQCGAVIDGRGYRSVTLHEMLAWAPEHWDGRSTVLALGSTYNGYSSPKNGMFTPYLHSRPGSGHRCLGLYQRYPKITMMSSLMFLVVRRTV